jgi:iron complex transport system substrate-binding protein
LEYQLQPARRRSLFVSAAAISIGALTLSACTPVDSMTSEGSSNASDAAVTVDNCGTPVTFAAAPERVITIKSTSTEMLLALGLGDRIIGTAFQDGPVAEQWTAAAASLTVISDQVPGQEAVLEAAPDMVYGGWESNFSADGAGERADLQALGIATYVSPAACKEPEYKPARLSFADIFDEITELASIFRVDPSTLIREQQDVLDGIVPSTAGLSALWYSSGDDTPYVGAGIGAPQLVLDTIGLTNIAADVKDTWTPLGWEAIIAANPDVIVLVDATWNSAASKMETLAANPVTANLDAVKNKRYLVVPFAAAEAGVRSAAAAADLSKQLAALSF